MKLYVPLAVDLATTIFKADEFPVAGFGVNVAVAPAGSALMLSATGPENPPVRVTVTV